MVFSGQYTSMSTTPIVVYTLISASIWVSFVLEATITSVFFAGLILWRERKRKKKRVKKELKRENFPIIVPLPLIAQSRYAEMLLNFEALFSGKSGYKTGCIKWNSFWVTLLFPKVGGGMSIVHVVRLWWHKLIAFRLKIYIWMSNFRQLTLSGLQYRPSRLWYLKKIPSPPHLPL